MKRPSVYRAFLAGLCLLGLTVAPSVLTAELLSKRYEFKDGVVLEIAVPMRSGLRLESVLFRMPPTVEGRLTRAAGLLNANVVVENTSQAALKVGLAIALFDGEDRLLAVASGGSKLASIKPAHKKTFTLEFDGVFAEANRAKTFQISLEPKN
jgi:hypothetical protein